VRLDLGAQVLWLTRSGPTRTTSATCFRAAVGRAASACPYPHCSVQGPNRFHRRASAPGAASSIWPPDRHGLRCRRTDRGLVARHPGDPVPRFATASSSSWASLPALIVSGVLLSPRTSTHRHPTRARRRKSRRRFGPREDTMTMPSITFSRRTDQPFERASTRSRSGGPKTPTGGPRLRHHRSRQ